MQSVQSADRAVLSPYLNNRQAAEYLGLSHHTMNQIRSRRSDGPRYHVMGPRKIMYLREDLDAWARQKSFASTLEHKAAQGAIASGRD